jgi:hypothetical protein
MFKKSLEGILSSFQKTIDDLSALSADNLKEVAGNEVRISNLQTTNLELANEASRAVAVREKLVALLA